ncbi:ATP-binding protein [Candidatus Woesearchaeota archaeon]|nr:ATP-binding protein [Candidatus Woesearchaeota archaeon]
MNEKAVELFDPDCLDSLIRQIMDNLGPVKLSEFNIQPYEVPEDYIVKDIKVELSVFERQIRAAIEPVTQKAEDMGYSGNLFTALYEAVLNAFQHGNKSDENKKIILAYKITDQSAEFAIMDEGGIIDPLFIGYILRFRGNKHLNSFVSFYDFGNREKPQSNNGSGTHFIHIYADSVKYYKSPAGGTVVHLTATKEAQ